MQREEVKSIKVGKKKKKEKKDEKERKKPDSHTVSYYFMKVAAALFFSVKLIYIHNNWKIYYSRFHGHIVDTKCMLIATLLLILK